MRLPVILAGLGTVAAAVLLSMRRSFAADPGGLNAVTILPEVEVPPRPPLSTFRRPEFIPEAEAAARRHGVPVEGWVAQVWTESRFDPNVCSPAGACGLAQFMPGTAADFGIDPFDPEASLDAGARYMRRLYDRYGSWSLAAAAYNWGAGNVNKWLARQKEAPHETRNYVARLAPYYGENDPIALDLRFRPVIGD